MSDDQFDILDEPEDEPRKRKRKPKSRPLGIPWRWVLAAFAAGVGAVLLFFIPASVRLVTNDSMMAVTPTLPPLPTLVPSLPALIPSASPLPAGFHLPGEYVEDVAWHGDTMAAATLSRVGLYRDLNWLGNVNTYQFDNEKRDKYIDLAFSPDGNYLAAIKSDYWYQLGALTPGAYVAVWDSNGNFTYSFTPHSGNEGGFTTPYLGVAIAYSPDGRLLATGAGKGEVALWDTTGSYYQQVGSIFTFATGTLALAFSDDGRRLTALIRRDEDDPRTSCVDCGEIQVWNIGDIQNPYQEAFKMHLNWEVGLKAAISPNGQFAAFVDLVEENRCCTARSLQIWDVYVGSLVMEIPLSEYGSTIENLAFSDDSDSLTFVDQHLVEQSPDFKTLQTDLRVLGWRRGEDNSYQLQDINKQFDTDHIPYLPHVNEAGTWVQYINPRFNTVERWYIGTDQVQDMSL